MWLFSFFPDSWLHFAVLCVLTSGVGMYVLGYFSSFIPPLRLYKTQIQLIGTILAIAGVYFYGSYATEMEWRERVKEAEAKVAIAEAKSQETNTIIKKVYVDKIQVVHDKEIVIQEKIVEVAAKMDAKCEVIPEALDILNEAAKKPEVKK
jgi:hypothetical protein